MPETSPVRPPRVPPALVAAAGYFLPRLMFLATRYAPQVHWGDVAHALDGFPCDDLDLGSATFWDEWRTRWSAQADRYLQRAVTSTTMAGRARADRAAAACLHWAEFMDFDDAARKSALRDAARAAFRRSLAALDPASDAEFGAGVLPSGIEYWAVLPPRSRRGPGPLPAVVACNGLDSMTEIEVLSLAEAYLDRGIAVVLFEGPGQGNQVGRTPLLVEQETVVAALVERLREHPEIDSGRLAFLGVSFGGYLALRVAQSAVGAEFRTVVNLSGGPRVAPFAGLPRRLRADFTFALTGGGHATDEEMQERLDALVLEPGIPPRTDVYSVHGALDDIFPIAALRELDRGWGARHVLVEHEREAHVCLASIDPVNQDAADRVAGALHAERRTGHEVAV